jgi:hypothetical protein
MAIFKDNNFMFNDLDLEAVEFSFSNKKLLPWEGGCLWQRENEKPLLQLRKVFKKKERFLWLYSKKEIIEHELVHAKRLHFDEPIFEEVLAYQTSPSAFRKFFGPFFRNSKESLLFFLSSFTLIFMPVIYLAIFGFFILRLIRVQTIFLGTKKKLIKKFQCEKKTFEHMIQLKDKEIISIYKNKQF